MENYKILICEDELISAEFIKETIEEKGFEVVGVAQNKEEALTLIALKKPNLVLLDINMDEPLSGIKIAQQIRRLELNCSFFFLTAFSDVNTIESAINTEPLAYLVKPLDKSTLLANLTLAKFKFDSSKKLNRTQLIFQTETDQKTYFLEDISHIESAANYSIFYFTNGKKEIERIGISQVVSQSNNNLFRIHKSFCVNPTNINRFSSLKAFLKDGTQLPIGRKFKDDIKDFFQNH